MQLSSAASSSSAGPSFRKWSAPSVRTKRIGWRVRVSAASRSATSMGAKSSRSPWIMWIGMFSRASARRAWRSCGFWPVHSMTAWRRSRGITFSVRPPTSSSQREVGPVSPKKPESSTRLATLVGLASAIRAAIAAP